jgi:hypothetical protein
MPKDGPRQLELALGKEPQVETYYGRRIDDMTLEEARKALRHCIREMSLREQEEDELWETWQRFGFPEGPRQRTPVAPSNTGNPRAGFYKTREP